MQDFKLGGGALKKIAPSGGRRENFWGISCEKLQFYAKKSYFFKFMGARNQDIIMVYEALIKVGIYGVSLANTRAQL
jgi:hypothetical protein